MENRILCGNAKTELAKLPKESVSCCVTSPPYYFMRSYQTEPVIWDGNKDCEHEWVSDKVYNDNLRYRAGENTTVGNNLNPEIYRYMHRGSTKSNVQNKGSINEAIAKGQICEKCLSWKGELGQEPSVELFVAHLIQIFDEVYRVLRKDGVLFVNLADKYGGSGNGSWNAPIEIRGKQYRKTKQNVDQEFLAPALPQNKSAKSLLLIPERFVIAMSDRGWIVRNKNVWYKTNAMPESCRDRFSRSWEYVYMFTKSKNYYFEQQFEPLANPERINFQCGSRSNGLNPDRNDNDWGYRSKRKLQGTNYGGDGKGLHNRSEWCDNSGNFIAYPLGRNKRDVFIQATRPTKIRHFASYPIELISPLISAGCPEFICKNCGKPRRKIFNSHATKREAQWHDEKYGNEDQKTQRLGRLQPAGNVINTQTFDGWKECGCDNPEYEPGVVLDPFGGICTTAIAAKRLNRGYITIDLNPEYVEWGKERIEKDSKPKRKTKAEKMAELERELEDRQLELF